MASKEVVKDVRTALQLEQELQISYAQHGVAVLDIYSAEWGPCRAVNEVFKRLLTDCTDGVHLRFLSVECHAVLNSLKNGDEQRNPQRLKNLDAIRDTLPEGWQSILEERAGQSKPYFFFYKEGKKAGHVEGVNTPLIRAMVKDLCTVKVPASQVITNQRLLEFWEEHLNPEESETTYEKFFKAVLSACKYTVPFSDVEKQILLDAIAVPKDAKEKVIQAQLLQKWFGDDEVKTIQLLTVELLPEYETRAAKALVKEAEERKAAEEQRAREAKEAEERLVAEKAAEEERLRAAAAAKAASEKEEPTEELLSKVPELRSAADSNEGAAEAELRQAVGSTALSASPEVVSVLGVEQANADAEAKLEALQGVATLSASLTVSSGSIVSVNAIREASEAKVAGDVPSLAKLATFLALSEGAIGGSSFSGCRSALVGGTLFDSQPAVAATLAFTAAVQAPAALYWSGSKAGVASGAELLAVEGGSFVLPPFTLLTEAAVEGAEFTLVVKGLPHAVFLGGAWATHWYTAFTSDQVGEQEVQATFSNFVLDAVDTFAANYSTQCHADEKKYAALQRLQSRGPHAEESRDAPPPPAEAEPDAAPAAEPAPEPEEAQAAAEPEATPEVPAAEPEAPAANAAEPEAAPAPADPEEAPAAAAAEPEAPPAAAEGEEAPAAAAAEEAPKADE